jgi:hypothetical protein
MSANGYRGSRKKATLEEYIPPTTSLKTVTHYATIITTLAGPNV